MRFGMREAIFLVLLLAMPIAAYMFVFKPRNVQIAEALQQINQKKAKLDRLAAATKNIDNLGNEIDKLSKTVELFEKKLPAQREVEVILRQVWEMAAKHRLVPKSVRTEKPVTAAQYAELPIMMTIYGNFDGFYSFLLDLEQLKRITRMPKMKLEKIVGNDVSDGQMRAVIVLSIYFDPQGQSVGNKANERHRL